MGEFSEKKLNNLQDRISDRTPSFKSNWDEIDNSFNFTTWLRAWSDLSVMLSKDPFVSKLVPLHFNFSKSGQYWEKAIITSSFKPQTQLKLISFKNRQFIAISQSDWIWRGVERFSLSIDNDSRYLNLVIDFNPIWSIELFPRLKDKRFEIFLHNNSIVSLFLQSSLSWVPICRLFRLVHRTRALTPDAVTVWSR